MVALATLATIIASQAVISGVFSITRQAVQLGQLPRMEIRHTSATERGQIYVPRINAMLCVGVVLIVLIFSTSDALAAAYGIAVTGVMVISTVLVGVVAPIAGNGAGLRSIAVFGVFGLIDLAFLASNALKIVQGGWLPLAVAAGVFVVMDTWRVGRRVHLEASARRIAAAGTVPGARRQESQRIAGHRGFPKLRAAMWRPARCCTASSITKCCMSASSGDGVVADTPFVSGGRRIEVEKMGKGFFESEFIYGFFETPDVPEALAAARAHGLAIEMDNSTFFLGRETWCRASKPSLSRWRVALYMWLASNALSPARFSVCRPTAWSNWARRSQSRIVHA